MTEAQVNNRMTAKEVVDNLEFLGEDGYLQELKDEGLTDDEAVETVMAMIHDSMECENFAEIDNEIRAILRAQLAAQG